mgnify:CR=1 FL=1
MYYLCISKTGLLALYFTLNVLKQTCFMILLQINTGIKMMGRAI